MAALKQASQKKITRPPFALQMGHRIREGLLILSITCAIFLLIAFGSYHPTDPGWSNTGTEHPVLNLGGRVGAFFADVFLSIFGYLAYVLPLMIVLAAWMSVHEALKFKLNEFLLKSLGFLLIILSMSGLIALSLKQFAVHLAIRGGGILGDLVVAGLTYIFNTTGGGLFLGAALLCGITLFAGVSWLGLLSYTGVHIKNLWHICQSRWQKPQKIAPKPLIEPKLKQPFLSKVKEVLQGSRPEKPKFTIVEPVTPKILAKKVVSPVTIAKGSVPPFNLLNSPVKSDKRSFSKTSFEELSQLVEQRLADFGVEVKVVAVHPGPVITRFELDLAPGIKVSKITGLAKDIARSLSVSSVRIVEVIPGKSFIGLELPNEHREVVGLREILESQRYTQARSPVSLALGKDIAGFSVIVDLAKMPHLLVAGTTGSGKSVSLNAMLLSMLFKATPEQLRLIMIDPKMLELSIYEGIPHLLTPVITDMKDAANALRWCVGEMDRRYRLMSTLGVRNLAGYNAKVLEAIKQNNPLPAPSWLAALPKQSPTLQTLPMIVVVVDELADMMMVVGKKVEELVTRIAQKARAAGIHLILATQRPSVDVITGLIKANVPTRIAFQVSSRIDSRTILDQQGAEQLLGNGDMLYLPPGTGVPVRVHGAYVADEEVHNVVAAWQTYGKPEYLEEVTEGINENNPFMEEGSGGEADPLYDEALKIVTESRRASISLVQRRLRIGYNRAARIMEDMESAGVVSSVDGSGMREVLANPPPG